MSFHCISLMHSTKILEAVFIDQNCSLKRFPHFNSKDGAGGCHKSTEQKRIIVKYNDEEKVKHLYQIHKQDAFLLPYEAGVTGTNN